MGKISFAGRWREELVATSDEGILVFEFAGARHVYFPTEERWKAQVPGWAQDKWEEYRSACIQWCAKDRIAISFVEDAHVYVTNGD